MNAVNEIKGLLFEELELIVRTTSNLIRRIEQDQWEYKPTDQMRTLRELVEIATHAQHHRSQLFTYLKLLGHDVNMFDLY
ncbi:hypothetical protein V5G20_00985 [Brevibacillus borstelensis]|uniref:hypothetical protein n=1 Tax=Brevibacillus borstelensis TaxID=45462 RepID=UPI0030CF2CCD